MTNQQALEIVAGASPAAPRESTRWRREDFFRSLVETLPIAVYATDGQGRITFYNEAATRLWGREPALGDDWWEGLWRIYWPDGRRMERHESPMGVTLTTGNAVHGTEAIAERPDGTRFPFIAYPTPLYETDGTPSGAVNLLVDISERRESERVSQHLAAIVESSDDAIISKNLFGIIQSWNKAAERMFGYTAAEIVGKSILTLIPPERHSEEDHILSRIRAGERIEHFETVRRTKNGEFIDISLVVSPVRDRNGRVVGASKIARDIRDRKAAEAGKELLLHELKHRVKNMLAAVHAMASQSFRSAPQAEKDVFAGRLQALALAHDLLTQQDWRSASAAQIADVALSPFMDRSKERVKFEGPDVSLTPNKALLLSMLLHELATNAVKYGSLSEGAGTIAIRWNLERGEGRVLHLEWSEAGGPQVEPPKTRGFGTRMIERALMSEKGSANFDFRPAGLVCEMRLPL